MKQIEPFRYVVSQGESARIEITPTEVAALVRAAQNGVSLENVGSPGKPAFHFPVRGDRPWHFLKVWYEFPAGASMNALYKVKIGVGDVNGFSGQSFDDLPITNRGPQDQPAQRILSYDFELDS